MDDKERYDLEALNVFIDKVMFNRPSDDQRWLEHAKIVRDQRGIDTIEVTEDMIAAAFALRDALCGEDLCERLGVSVKK